MLAGKNQNQIHKQASLDLADIESETLINAIAMADGPYPCSQISLQMNRILDQINIYHFKMC